MILFIYIFVDSISKLRLQTIPGNLSVSVKPYTEPTGCKCLFICLLNLLELIFSLSVCYVSICAFMHPFFLILSLCCTSYDHLVFHLSINFIIYPFSYI